MPFRFEIFESAAIPISFLSPDGRFLRANRSFLELFGYSEEVLLGMSVLDLTHEEDRDQTKGFLDSLLSDPRDPAKIEKRYRKRDGGVVHSRTLVSTVRDESGKLLYLVSRIQDITDIKIAQDSLVHQAKMAALGEMAAGLAHEINNPLTIIKGYADLIRMLIRRGDASHADISRHAEQISETALRMSRIIQALRGFLRDENELQFGLHEAGALIDEALTLCQARLKSQGVLLDRAGQLDARIRCSDVAITQVLVNLLNNSLYAVQNLDQRWIRVEFRRNQKEQVFSVIDSGPGVPAEIRGKVLLPFFTTKPPGEGSGLGLSVSKGMVEAHGGRIEIDTNCPNTKFDVILPLEAVTSAG